MSDLAHQHRIKEYLKAVSRLSQQHGLYLGSDMSKVEFGVRSFEDKLVVFDRHNEIQAYDVEVLRRFIDHKFINNYIWRE